MAYVGYVPVRTREHELEDESIVEFRRALTPRFVYREQTPDYGIDGDVEEFDDQGRATGLRYYTQLKATEEADLDKALRIYVPHDRAAYYGALRAPVLMVRYHALAQQLYVRWFHDFDPHEDRVNEKSLTFKWTDSHKWQAGRQQTLADEARAYFELTSPRLALPLEVYVGSKTEADGAVSVTELVIELRRVAMARREVINIVSDEPPAGASRVMLQDDRLLFDLAGVTGATLHSDGVSELGPEQLALEAMVLAALAFERVGQSALSARLTGTYFGCSVLAADEEVAVALSGEMAQARQITEALCLSEELDSHAMDIEELHPASFAFTLPAFVHASTLTNEELKLYRRTMRRRIARRKSAEVEGVGQEYVNLANHYRNRQSFMEALKLYDQAVEHDPVYAERMHWHYERAGALFGSGQYSEAAEAYERALEMGAPAIAGALGADALMFAGEFAAALELMAAFNAQEGGAPRETEYVLKERLLRELVDDLGLPRQDRRFHDAETLAGSIAGNDDDDHCRAVCREALDLDGLSGLAHYNLGVSERQQGLDVDAARHFAAAGLVTQWDREAWAQAVILEMRVGDPDEVVPALVFTGQRMSGGELLSHLRLHVREGSADTDLLEKADAIFESASGDEEVFTLRVLRAADVDEVDISPVPHRRERFDPSDQQGRR